MFFFRLKFRGFINFIIMSNNNGKLYYAVARGREIGIYDTWQECKLRIDGFYQAKYKKFFSLEEAKEFINFWKDYDLTQNKSELFIDGEENKSYNEDSFTQQHNEESQQQTTQDISFSKSIQSSSVTDNLKLPSSTFQNSNKLDKKTIDVLALNLRLDSFEKRFDACLKEIGAITSQISYMREEIMEIKEQVFPKVNLLINNSPKKFKDNFYETNVESTKLNNLKRKLLRNDSKESKRSNIDNDFFDYCNIKVEASNYTSFTVDEDEYVHVYTDGACHSNGKKEAKAGIGIWFGESHPLNISEPVQGSATCNSAEIQAARIAIAIADKAGIKKLKIFTDSDFLINCATKWIHRWKQNGWKLVKGGQVKNKVELMKLDEISSKIDVRWVKVEGHAGILGNEMADRLANEGAAKYKKYFWEKN